MSAYANGPAVFGMSLSLSILSIIAVGGRLFIRKTYGQGFGADDWFMLPALLCTVGIALSLMIGVGDHAVGYAAGNPEYPTVDQPFIIVQQVWYALFMINVLGLMFARLSIVFFYRRVFHTGHNKAFNYSTLALIAFIIIWGISFFFAQMFQCGTNFWANWGTYDDLVNYCFPSDKFNLIYVVSDAFADLVLFIIPIPLIIRLRMSIARRLAVLLIFSIGALTLVTSIMRVVYFISIYTDTLYVDVGDLDPILEYTIFFYWTMLESGLSIIVACLPTFQVWFRKITVDTVIKNVRGIFSVQSFSRSSRGSAEEKNRETASSEASLKNETFEMLSSKEIGVKSEITMVVT